MFGAGRDRLDAPERGELLAEVQRAVTDDPAATAAREHVGGPEASESGFADLIDRGVDYVEVSCEWRSDGARRFYEDNGFEPKQVTYTRRVD